MVESAYRNIFRLLSMLGRSFGGIRPRRLEHVLASRGYPILRETDFFWIRDRWGSQMRVNPFFLIDREIVWAGAYQDSLHRLIEKVVRPGMICFDIGANIGSIGLHLGRKVGNDGHVHAFEPAPSVVSRLQANVDRNEMQAVISIHEIAIASHTGTMTLSHAKPTEINHGMGTVTATAHTFLSERKEIPAMTLDDFVRENDIPRLDFLKADIQGAEYGMLQGARDSLSKFKPLLVLEVSPEDLAVGNITPADLLCLLTELGYQARTFDSRGNFGNRLTALEVSGYVGDIVCEPLA